MNCVSLNFPQKVTDCSHRCSRMIYILMVAPKINTVGGAGPQTELDPYSEFWGPWMGIWGRWL